MNPKIYVRTALRTIYTKIRSSNIRFSEGKKVTIFEQAKKMTDPTDGRFMKGTENKNILQMVNMLLDYK